MSHVRTDATKIANPNVVVLRGVVERLAKQRQGTLAKAANGYYGDKASVASNIDLAIFTPAVKRGMAVNADAKTGLSFKGDGYGYEQDYRKLQLDIANGYLDDEIETAMKMAQYSVKRTVTEGGTATFVGDSVDGTKVTIIRQANGKLDWEFEGFAGNTCFDVQKVIADILKARGVNTTEESVTVKETPERWLEEKLPDRETERNN